YAFERTGTGSEGCGVGERFGWAHVPHDWRERRDEQWHARHAIFFGQPGGNCRFDRNGVRRAILRWPHRCSGMRQKHARRIDGYGSPQQALDPAVRRRHPRWKLERSEEHTSELQSRENLVCRLLLEKKN